MESQEPAFLAARLALLALRSAVDQATPLATDRVQFGAAASPISTDEAAQLLAAKPKPLFCDAGVRDGTLFVSCRSLSATDASYYPEYEMRRRDDDESGGFMGFLRDQYGPGDHLVAVLGRDESLILPQSVVERWSHEYEMAASYSTDDIDNQWSQSDPDYVEAKRNGAKGVLHFSAPASSAVTPDYFYTVSFESAGDNTLSGDAEEHLVRMARMNHNMLRALIDAGADFTSSSDSWQRKQLDAAKHHLVHTARMLKQILKGKTMPPDVAAFVEECDKHLMPPS